nr:structural protein [Tolivirales sp.]
MNSTKNTQPKSKPKRNRKNKGRSKQNQAPIAKNNATRTSNPVIKQNGKCVTVTHREYIGEITAPNAGYVVRGFNVNPGLASTFPWLSSIAIRFESYLFDRLHFSYQPTCPSTTPGSVMLAIDYDASDALANNKVTLMSYEGATRTNPWDETTFNARSSDLHKFGIQRYVRGGIVTGDIKTFDAGIFQLATQNTPATDTTLGELYVEYTVRLFTPQISAVAAGNFKNSGTQVGTITMPSGTAIPQLIAEYAGTATSPLFWLDPVTASSPNPLLYINTNTIGQFLLALRSSDNSIVDLVKQFRQTALSNNNYRGNPFRINRLTATEGYGVSNVANNYAQVFQLLAEPNPTNPTDPGAGILPLMLQRPASGNYKLNLSMIPTVTSAIAQSVTVPIDDSKTWTWPQINLPLLNSVVGRMADGINTITVVTDKERPESIDSKR